MTGLKHNGNDYISPIFSVPIAIITGFIVVCFLGYIFFPLFIYRPIEPTLIYTYTLHPLCRYKFSFKKAYPHGLEIILRLILAHILVSPLTILRIIGSSVS